MAEVKLGAAQQAKVRAELVESQARLAAAQPANTNNRQEIDRLAAELAVGRSMLADLTTALSESGKQFLELAASLADRKADKPQA